MPNTHVSFSIFAIAVAACAPPPAAEDAVAQQLSIGTIDAVTIDSPGPCPTGIPLVYNDHNQVATTCRYYTLWNASAGFPGSCNGSNTVYPTAMCSNGKFYTAEYNQADSTSHPHAGVQFCSVGQINVAISGDSSDYWPPGTACWFALDYRPDPPTTSAPAPAFSNTFGPVGSNLITAIHDEGISNGLEVIRLDGTFPNAQAAASASCNNTTVAAAIQSSSSTQVRLAVSTSMTATPTSCEFQLTDTRGSPGGVSNPIALRLGGAAPSLPVSVGAYHWGSYLQPDQPATQAMPAAAAQLSAAGLGSVLRIPIGPGHRVTGSDGLYLDSNLIQSSCPTTAAYLPCAVALAPYQSTFATLPVATQTHPVYAILTAYDSAATGPYGGRGDYGIPSSMSDPGERAAIISEYEALTLALYRTQQGTGRRFIISNWEENLDYSDCSGFSGGLVDLNTSCASAPTAAQQGSCAFTQYLILRKTGISRGIADAAAAGYTTGSNPPSVAMGVEFKFPGTANTQLACAVPSVAATALTPSVTDYTLYSSWQSLNGNTMDEDLAGLKGFLQDHTAAPHPQLLIGELGDEDIGGVGRGAWAMAENVKAAVRAGLPAITMWIASGSQVNFGNGSGLLNPDGSDTPTMGILRSALTGYSETLPAPVQINGAHDVGIDQTFWSSPVVGPRRWFELYGNFPTSGGSYSVITRCHWLGSPDPGSTTTQVCTPTSSPCFLNFASSGQINVGFVTPPASKASWCTFQVITAQGASPEFGARSACALPSCTTDAQCAAHSPGSLCNQAAHTCAFDAPRVQINNATPDCLCSDGSC